MHDMFHNYNTDENQQWKCDKIAPEIIFHNYNADGLKIIKMVVQVLDDADENNKNGKCCDQKQIWM